MKLNYFSLILLIAIMICGCEGNSGGKPAQSASSTQTEKKTETVKEAKDRLLNEFIKYVEESGVPVPLDILKKQMSDSLDKIIAQNEESHALTDNQLIALIKKTLDDAKTKVIESSIQF